MRQPMNDALLAIPNGFRLERLEVYNWGTFNGRAYALEVNGGTALLTGANGSGKSTLVDALLTLLVPNIKRGYNQASGAERRRERDERSYVRGAYGRIRDTENTTGVVQYLRGKESLSALLAQFRNARTGQLLTLGQVFWLQDEGLRKIHVIALSALTVAEHIGGVARPDELRKRLKAAGAEIFDEFSQYSKRFCKLFGLRSEKALDLFNQTVSIKEIGGLNEFVRVHMLERTDAHSRILGLRENFENLTRAHDAIVRAEQQLERLKPLLAEGSQYRATQARQREAERAGDATTLVFARQKANLLDTLIGDSRERLTRLRDTVGASEARVAGLEREEIDLNVAISSDRDGQLLQNLRREREHIGERRREKKLRAEKYSAVARQLNLPEYSDEASFHETARQARAAIPPLDMRVQSLIGRRDDQKAEVVRRSSICRELQAELESLRGRRSQIPAEDLRIRTQIASALKIPEAELPFVGEVLRVREEAHQWEGAIERLLRGYGRQLLAPEAHYRRLSAYVDTTNLRGRLVYHRVGEGRAAPNTSRLGDDALFHRLEIKPGSAVYDWLRADLIEHYDYVCCATIEQFQRERRAITMNGQIKSSGARHEKDDRFTLGDRKQYVLGWDNRDKIAALEAELATEQRALNAASEVVSAIEKEQKQREEQRRRLQDLLAYDEFAAIDWHAEEQREQELIVQMRELEASSDRLAQLREQLTSLKQRLSQERADLRRTEVQIGTLEDNLKRHERERSELLARLAATPLDPSITARVEAALADLKTERPTLDTIDPLAARVTQYFQNSARTLLANLSQLQASIEKQMLSFKRDFPAETESIDSSVAAIDEFGRMLARIEREDLPRHAQRFKELLDEKVITDIAMFKGALEKQVEEIRASIAILNESLHKIDYTPATYIQLCHDANRDREIVEFRQTLRACLPDVGQPRTAEANEASFQRVRALIKRFESEERWTAKVTDVRNWLEFSAEERYREDESLKNYYSDSSGKSGGQKAKLAYTILASAIAYQYGLDDPDARSRSLRFVVVDEAFSKSDEVNARYAMELFRQLDLQLLVVTPLDKTHVVEPYISACHFVVNNAEENDSRVFNLTIDEYRERKAHFQGGALDI